MSLLRLHPDDDVAVVLTDLAAGASVDGLTLRDAVAAGHKVAVRAVAPGAPVRRYGQVIGVAAADIGPGDWVHTHNLTMSEADRAAEVGMDRRPLPAPVHPATWSGYRRADGRWGTRNTLAVLTSVNCSATVARRIADAFPVDALPEGVDDVVAYTHTGGCGGASDGDDIRLLQRTLAGYARHPNVAGVLIVGLGCEANQIPDWLAREGLTPGPALRTLSIQEAGGTLKAIEAGKSIVRDLIAVAAKARREPAPVSGLAVGLQCGGSDGWSGVTANPALGRAVDRLIAHGGSAMLSETPEIWGAEHLLLRRADPDTARRLMDRLAWWRDHAEANGMALNNNPSPGNLKGGLTTILEKSLGAVAKAGSAPLEDVIGYAQPLRKPGLTFMDSPGYDPCSATGQIASGANLIAFTTGRGSVFGSKPAPCLKIASNARLAGWMAEDVDVDASPVLDGESLDAMGARIFDRLLLLASGQPSASEALGIGDAEFVPWQRGAYL
ncbi:UxaA family hydrolase [Brevundimonas aurifodinae]|uniref:Altronate dehydratase family protein n=2 Tax=Brevundimonas TaxID=41275 RepID=A0ABV1NLY7_9CAUL|nr:MAG: galactonate dehydratase [Brevundimonas sp. 12-68-7]OYX36166.1 MAG: galactonate dehydratase [Brevundimonas subvibrioides]